MMTLTSLLSKVVLSFLFFFLCSFLFLTRVGEGSANGAVKKNSDGSMTCKFAPTVSGHYVAQVRFDARGGRMQEVEQVKEKTRN